jgi:uncharacterized protein (DUF58 family)
MRLKIYSGWTIAVVVVLVLVYGFGVSWSMSFVGLLGLALCVAVVTLNLTKHRRRDSGSYNQWTQSPSAIEFRRQDREPGDRRGQSR